MLSLRLRTCRSVGSAASAAASSARSRPCSLSSSLEESPPAPSGRRVGGGAAGYVGGWVGRATLADRRSVWTGPGATSAFPNRSLLRQRQSACGAGDSPRTYSGTSSLLAPPPPAAAPAATHVEAANGASDAQLNAVADPREEFSIRAREQGETTGQGGRREGPGKTRGRGGGYGRTETKKIVVEGEKRPKMLKALSVHLRDEDILFLDNHVFAVCKPPGMLSQPDQTGDSCLADLATDYMKRRYKGEARSFIANVHRLDRPVSGVVCFARTTKAAQRLSKTFRERENVHKVYYAVVEGDLDGEGTLQHILQPRQSKNRSHVVQVREGKTMAETLREVGKTAKKAVLDYAAIYTHRHRDRVQTLVRVRVYTGRKHQIRAQLAHIGHPVVGDAKYGAPGRFPDKSIALHARALTIPHPINRVPLVFNAPPPPLWRDMFDNALVETMMLDEGVRGLIPPRPNIIEGGRRGGKGEAAPASKRSVVKSALTDPASRTRDGGGRPLSQQQHQQQHQQQQNGKGDGKGKGGVVPPSPPSEPTLSWEPLPR